MDSLILDTICNNLIKNKRLKMKSQLDLVKSMFNNRFENIKNTHVLERMCKIETYRLQLDQLRNIPNIQQRSDEWYRVRKSLITASDFAQALGKGKFGSKKQFMKKKCGYEEDVIDMNIPPLQCGVRYEEVANMLYK